MHLAECRQKENCIGFIGNKKIAIIKQLSAIKKKSDNHEENLIVIGFVSLCSDLADNIFELHQREQHFCIRF